MKPLILLLTALLAIAPAIAQEGEKTKGWFLLEIHPMPDLAVIVDEEFYVFEDPYLAEYTKTQAKILNSSVILDRAFERVKDQVALEKLDKELIQLISHRIIDSEHTITQSYNGLSADAAATLSKAIIETYRDYTRKQWRARLMPQLATLRDQLNRKSQELDEMRNNYLRLAQKNGLSIPSQIAPDTAKTLFATWFTEIREEEGPDAALGAASQVQSQLDLLAEIHQTESLLNDLRSRAAKAELALSFDFNPITRHAE